MGTAQLLSIADAKLAYEALRSHGYDATSIRKRLGLGDSSATIDYVVSDPVRRLKLANWMRIAGIKIRDHGQP
jgi:hypothetical protein